MADPVTTPATPAKVQPVVDPKTTFSPENLNESAQKYRTELITMPMFALRMATQHMGMRTGIRYKEHVHELTGKFQLGNFDKYKKGDGATAIKQRTLETFLGNCIEPIDPVSLYKTLWGSDVVNPSGQKNQPWTKRICAFIAAQIGEHMFDYLWTAKHDDEDTKLTMKWFNGFCAIEDVEIASGAMSAQEQNLFNLPTITSENAEDVLNEFIWGSEAVNSTWRGVHKKLRDAHGLKLFMSDRTKHLYEVCYQMNHGALPYNTQFQKAHLDGKTNIEFVALANVPEDYLCLTSKNNILTLWNQETSDEGFEVKGSLTSHYDVDFISNLFFGLQYLSINKEMLAVARKANTTYTAW
jgi:hypothetical protein